MTQAAKRPEPVEQREFERARAELAGKMFVPAEEATIDCQVVDLSAGGAGILCDDMPPLNAYVVLYVDGFGRFEAVVARVEGEVLALRFVCHGVVHIYRKFEFLFCWSGSGKTPNGWWNGPHRISAPRIA